MYRIITSTTKEEHFESPNAAAFGMMAYCGSSYPTSAATVSSASPLKIAIRMPNSSPDATKQYYGDYDVYGDLYVHGNIYARNLEHSVESMEEVKIVMLDTEPNSNVWMGNVGDMAFTSNHAFLCVEPDNWIRWKIDSRW